MAPRRRSRRRSRPRAGPAPTAGPPRGARRRAATQRCASVSAIAEPEGAQQRRSPRARLGEDEHPLAEGERAEQVDARDQRIARSASGANRRRCGRRRGQVLEVASLLLRALPVDRLDPDQGAVALAAARRPRRAAHLVAGPQLAAADLRGGDVDVALGLVQAAQPQEAVALRHPVEHPGDRLGLRLLSSARPPARSPPLVGLLLGPLLRLAVRPLEARVDRLLAAAGRPSPAPRAPRSPRSARRASASGSAARRARARAGGAPPGVGPCRAIDGAAC